VILALLASPSLGDLPGIAARPVLPLGPRCRTDKSVENLKCRLFDLSYLSSTCTIFVLSLMFVPLDPFSRYVFLPCFLVFYPSESTNWIVGNKLSSVQVAFTSRW